MEQQTDLIAEAINLTMFGMGFVFLFLTLLVFVTKLMSIVIQKMNKQSQDDDTHHDDHLSLKDELDEETKFVIEQAIKMHRGA
ncbi:MAG: sodium pump decarboxylase subunit gamma [Candidatus Thioglobus sp.]|jgi:oxaloacetate decarboxylase gamma subunit|uniref:Oxaloacetate decarboxylase gamma chain n=1 Tax=hydrothermal vent metagenome TaxID=652676 RepID=A0A1W1DM72_9ZZZZ|nr:MAG: sodium pump decarboxylase subunit gamma [Candidatus Thioglobus sp.]RUM80690.1 MAG: sodium pump decarboxylase subunit gamma [Candidatus Thioglobus sp.]RUM81161.1 MAG: sodium pump decarboxylase subunit gamma [Candidatus Thioglobus sp.]RUM83674.1 MAG: sodium pump decarboxylase subunit gamma [Candidatus Thioglobus sp.]